ncbi:hypothetical protein GGF32_003553 [Allomyces javanicus]|nr:hypothetical protein GGF32_003553 [Allomyces javanicus]
MQQQPPRPLPLLLGGVMGDPVEFLHRNRTVISASSASIVGTVAGFPFDSVKTRMQTFSYPSMAACVSQTYRAEGVPGFFRGMVPQLMSVAFVKSASFSVYVKTRAHLSQYTPNPTHSAAGLMLVSMGGGFTSGSMMAILTQPLELVKVLRQLQELIRRNPTSAPSSSTSTPVPLRPMAPTSTLGLAREIVRVRGVTGLYHGFASHYLREAFGSSVYFASYELSKFAVVKASGVEANVLTHMLAGGACGVVASTFVFPADVVKSILQRETLSPTPQYRGFWHCMTSLYAAGGLRPFYRGLSATLVRAAPIHSLNWVVYEGVLRLCTKVEERLADP